MAKRENELDGFAVAMRSLTAACGALTGVVIAPLKQQYVTMSAVTPGNEATFVVPYVIEGLTEPVSVPAQQLQDALKGHLGGSIKFAKSALVLTAGNFRATINTTSENALPELPLPDADTEGLVKFTLTPELYALFQTQLPLLSIERTHANAPDIMLIARISSGKVYLAAFERFQFCLTRFKAEGDIDDLNIAVPYQRFAALIKDLPVVSCTMLVTPDYLMVVGKAFRMRIALPSVNPDAAISPELAYSHSKTLIESANSGALCSLPIADLNSLLDSGKSLLAAGSRVQFKPTRSGVTATIESPFGSVTIGLRATKADKPFGLDVRYMQALVAKAGRGREAVNIRLAGDMSACSYGDLMYFAALAAEDDDGADTE